MTKEYNIKPTEKQKRYALNRVEGLNKKESALKAGYPLSVAEAPTIIERTKGFQKLAELYFPNDFLMEEHKKNIVQDSDKGAKNKALDMAYRLKDAYPKDEAEFEAGGLFIKIGKKTQKDE